MIPVLALGISGCGLFIKAKSPISKVPSDGRETVQESGGNPIVVRLTQPAKIAGISVTKGTIIQQTGDKTCDVTTQDATTVGKVAVPAKSKIELVVRESMLTGNRYGWNGVVHIGAATVYGEHKVETGDRLFFAGDLFKGATLAQITTATAREIKGREYPAGTIVDIDRKGAITGVYSPQAQAMLAAEREAYKKQKAEKEQRCKEVCAPLAGNLTEHSKCMGKCR